MLRKEFRIKMNCQLKSSDRRRLYSDILRAFLQLTEIQLQVSFPTKEPVQHVKILNNQGKTISVYFCKGQPLIVHLDERIFPTVYFLWMHPDILYSYTITPFVLEKLLKGADLMIPGIIKDEDRPYIMVDRGEIVSVNLTNNRACVAVGIALMSSEDMELSVRGKAVNIIHTIDDGLFKLASEKVIMPTLSFPVRIERRLDLDAQPSVTEGIDLDKLSVDASDDKKVTLDAQPSVIEGIDLDKRSVDTSDDKKVTLDAQPSVIEGIDLDKQSVDASDDKKVTLDDVLLNAFLHVIKTSGNQIQLPILTNLFYSSYLLRAIPTSQNFDIKKTKYKKLSRFLSAMEMEGIIKLFRLPKDVQTIVDIDSKHHLLTNYTYIFQDCEERKDKDEKESLPNLEIIESFVINAAVLKLFCQMGHKKDQYFSAQEIRKMITDYVKKENLQDPKQKELIIMNPILSDVTQSNCVSAEWKWLMDRIMGKMGNRFEVKKNGITINSGKGKIPPIDIYIRIRSGQKKVTVADCLDIYGIDLHEFSRVCQHALAASTTVKVSNTSKKGVQFQIQGCHVSYITKLLTDKYSIPKKYITDSTNQN